MKNIHSSETMLRGVIAGAAGGLAEIAWVTLYARRTSGRQRGDSQQGRDHRAGHKRIATCQPGERPVQHPPIHMTLAVMLGVALAFAWRSFSAKRGGTASPYRFMLAALAGVWAVNFLVVLPILSPAFIAAGAAYAISLTSNCSSVWRRLRYCARRPTPRTPMRSRGLFAC